MSRRFVTPQWVTVSGLLLMVSSVLVPPAVAGPITFSSSAFRQSLPVTLHITAAEFTHVSRTMESQWGPTWAQHRDAWTRELLRLRKDLGTEFGGGGGDGRPATRSGGDGSAKSRDEEVGPVRHTSARQQHGPKNQSGPSVEHRNGPGVGQAQRPSGGDGGDVGSGTGDGAGIGDLPGLPHVGNNGSDPGDLSDGPPDAVLSGPFGDAPIIDSVNGPQEPTAQFITADQSPRVLIPEPATVGLLGVGLLSAGLRVRRRSLRPSRTR